MVISGSGGALLTKIGGDTISKLLSSLLEKRLLKKGSDDEKIKENIEPHVDEIFNKCTVIKTILNPHSPAKFLQIYSTQRFDFGKGKIDQYDLVSLIKSFDKNYVITGTGGSGKSMFTRYLWLSLFLDGDGRVPLYVELRDVNEITSIDLVNYIYHRITLGKASLSERQYKKHLENGDFVIILDGYDEVFKSQKLPLSKSINNLAEIFPNTKMVITSRPNDDFAAWQSFDVVKIAPMYQQDAVELIDKSEFDPEAKKKFRKIITDDKLYKSYSGFLENPLLTCMMMLAYSYNYSIPDKMYLFYEQAFQALYSRHDSYKPGGFKRQFSTSLREDEFKRLFSYFCLISYYEQKVSFTKEEIIDRINRAIKFENFNTTPEDFLCDLVDCVCMIVPDGIVYNFSHRSFQEYFAAYCLSHVSSGKYREIVSRIASRSGDVVIKLLNEMNFDAFRRLYVLPIADEHKSVLQLGLKNKDIALGMKMLGIEFAVRKLSTRGEPEARYVAMIEDKNARSGDAEKAKVYEECEGLVSAVGALKPYMPISRRNRNNYEKKLEELAIYFKIYEGDSLLINSPQDKLNYSFSRKGKAVTGKNISDDRADAIFKQTVMHEYVLNHLKRVDQYIKLAREAEASATEALENIFQ